MPPFDMKTYFGLIRLVPDAEGKDKLIEIQVYLPKKQFRDLKEFMVLSGYEGTVEMSKVRIVRRGRDNPSINAFIDQE